MVRSLNNSSVAADVGHGGEGIKHLGSRDSGHAVHTKGSQLPVSQRLDQIWVLSRVEEGVEIGSLSEQKNKIRKTWENKFINQFSPEELRLLQRGLPQLQSDILLEGRLLPDNLGSGSSEVIISEAGELASSLLDVDSEALLGEHGRHGGCAGHPLLISPALCGDTNVQLVVGSPLHLRWGGISQPSRGGPETSD